MKTVFNSTCIVFVLLAACPPAFAHFPWLFVNDDGRLALFFGEGLADRNYKMPESLSTAEVFAGSGPSRALVDLAQVESESFVGLVSKSTVGDSQRFTTQLTYGIYHGNRLEYYATHLSGELPKSRSSASDAKQDGLHAELIATFDGVELLVTWQGKPLSDSEVHLYCVEGHEEAVATTDKEGTVKFSEEFLEAGLNGIMFGHTAKGDGGEIGGQSYESTMHYYTLTFSQPGRESLPTEFDSLPFEITSFGAARVGKTAYVYGGHTGDAHSYSTEEQSNKLLALNLADATAKWQVIGTNQRLQGLAMVPYKSSLILIGGFTAKNGKGEEHDLHSQVAVRRFDTVTKIWSDLPSLPSGRSSHDAAIIENSVYVVGGWNMSGEDETDWHRSALMLDLNAPNPKWQELPRPPFQRRALATVAHEGKVYVIGGMDKENGPTRAVSVFDPSNQTWSEGPELLGKGRMAGFGAAGWSVGGQLIVSTYEGAILRMSDNEKGWVNAGESDDSRFFHRLIPLAERSLVAVGGANMEEGKYLNLEVLRWEK